jgi:hypothetical protein
MDSKSDQAFKAMCKILERAGYHAIDLDYYREGYYKVSAKSPDNNVRVTLGQHRSYYKAIAEAKEYVK